KIMLTLLNKSILYSRAYNYKNQKKLYKKSIYHKKNFKIKKIKYNKEQLDIVEKGKLTCYVGKHNKKRDIERKEFKEIKNKVISLNERDKQIQYIKESKGVGLEKVHFHVHFEHNNDHYKTINTSVDSVKNLIDDGSVIVYEKIPVIYGFTPLCKIPKELADLYKDSSIYELIDIETTENVIANKVKNKYKLKNIEDIRENFKENGTYLD